MSERIAYLEAVVGADITQFRKSMRDIRTETGILSDVIGGISGAAKTMTYAFTAPMVALGTYAVQAASTFDSEMRNINSIAQLPEAQFKILSDQVLQFGKDTRSGADGAAKALYEVYSAGITGADAFSIMTIGTKTAEAGLADLATTVKGLTAAGLTFGDTGEAAMQRYSNATTLAVQLGVGSLDVFNTGISNVIGTGSLLGATYEDLSANIAFMSQRGISFASAGTYMNNALSKLIKPGDELSKMFTTLHVKSGKDLISTFGGIEGALRAIYGQIGNDETKWAKLFPDVRGFKAVAPYIKAFAKDGKDAVGDFFSDFDDKMEHSNVTELAWEQQMKSFSATIDHFKSALNGVAIVIGQAIIPLISPLINHVTNLLNGLSNTNPEVVKLGVAFIGVVAAAAPVIWLLTSMISPLGLILGAVAALGTAFALNFGGIQTTVKNAISSVLGDITPLKNTLSDFWKQVFPPTPADASSIFDSPIPINVSDWITVEKPMSLWDLYKSHDYDKMFSWDEFLKSAKEGGWDGKALDIGEKIKLPDPVKMTGAATGLNLIADGIKNVYAHMKNKDTEYDPVSGKVVEKQISLFDRIVDAAAVAWPKIKVSLQTLWNNITGWVTGTGIPLLDGAGSKVLAAIAGWFSPTAGGGDTATYEGMRNLVGGGAQKGLESGVSTLEKTFPKIAAGLRALVDNVGAWIMTEGVPTVSRAIGYLVGTVGVKFGELLGNLGNFLSGGGAGDAANGVKGAVVDPAVAGFNDAMKDAKIKDGADRFFTGLAGVFVAAAGVSVFGQMLVGKGLLSAIWGTLGSVLGGGVKIVSGLGGIGGKMINGLLNTAAGANLSNKVNNIGGSIMSAISDSLSVAASAVTNTFDKVASPIMTAISGALETKALQGMMLWDKVTAAIGAGLATATGAVTAATSWVMAAVAPLAVPIMTALSAVIAAAPILPVILAGIAIVGLLSLVLPPEVKQKFSDLFNAILAPGSIDPMPVDLQAKVDTLMMDIPSDILNSAGTDVYGKIMNYFVMANQGGKEYGAADIELAAKVDKVVVDFKSGAIDEPTFNKMVDDLIKVANDTKNGTTGATPVEVKADATIKPTDDAKAKELADGMLNPVWTQVAANISAQSSLGGSTDTTVMAAGMTKPFIDQFTTVFGTTGTATVKWQEFVSSVNTGMNDTNNKMLETQGKVGAFSISTILSNTLAIASFNGYNTVKDKLKAVKDEAIELQNTLGSLIAHSPYEIVINVTTNGTVPAVAGGGDNGGKKLAVGEPNVPYDNFPAMLHQGEAVLTASQASMWRNMPSVLAHLGKGRSDNNTPAQNNTIIINGVQDVDTMLKELKRRGIKIGNDR